MEKFNPYEHLSVYHDADGNPIFENLEENGRPVTHKSSDGKYHSVLILKRYLSANSYRLWFKSEYPEGLIDVEDLTSPASFDAAKGIFVDSPEYKVKVTLYEDREMKKKIAQSYGVVRRGSRFEPGFSPEFETKNSFELAQAIALRNAMLNAGFIFDINAACLKEKDAQFINAINLGPESGYKPLEETALLQCDIFGAESDVALKKTDSSSEEKQDNAIRSTESDVLAFIKEMEEDTKEDINEQIGISEKDLAGEVVFMALDGAANKLKSLSGTRIKDLDEKLLSYFSSKDMKGKLSDETINALRIFAA